MVGEQNIFLVLVLVSCTGTFLSAYTASWALSLWTFITLTISAGAALSSLVVLCVLPLSIGLHFEFLGDSLIEMVLMLGAFKTWPAIFENGILNI